MYWSERLHRLGIRIYGSRINNRATLRVSREQTGARQSSEAETFNRLVRWGRKFRHLLETDEFDNVEFDGLDSQGAML
jgi:hypothetical protein